MIRHAGKRMKAIGVIPTIFVYTPCCSQKERQFKPIGNRPLLFYGMLSTILGVQIFSLGVMSELFIRFNTRSEKPVVKSRVGFGEEP